jgi:[CysO sulfur-carrier protein]-S-L-cysteine hydrolase
VNEPPAPASRRAPGAGTLITAGELAEICRHAEGEYPRECCGVLLVREPDERRLVRCANVQDALHARDPVRHPRDARTAYYIDPQDLLKIGRLEGEGFHVAVVYHSHIDTGAYFSETDRQNALIGGEPAYPDTTYVVVSVVGGRYAEAAAVRWDAATRTFPAVEFLEGRA